MAHYYDPEKKTVSCKVGSTPEVVQKTHYGRTTDPFIKYKGGRTVYPEGSIDGLIKSLQAIQKEYAGEYTDLSLNPERDCGCYDMNCGCSDTFYVYGKRAATEEEIQFHADKAAADEARREAQERAELARLSEKYGN